MCRAIRRKELRLAKSTAEAQMEQMGLAQETVICHLSKQLFIGRISLGKLDRQGEFVWNAVPDWPAPATMRGQMEAMRAV